MTAGIIFSYDKQISPSSEQRKVIYQRYIQVLRQLHKGSEVEAVEAEGRQAEPHEIAPPFSAENTPTLAVFLYCPIKKAKPLKKQLQ